MPVNKRIAVWMSEKKLQKINWQEFEAACISHGFELFKVGKFNIFQASDS